MNPPALRHGHGAAASAAAAAASAVAAASAAAAAAAVAAMHADDGEPDVLHHNADTDDIGEMRVAAPAAADERLDDRAASISAGVSADHAAAAAAAVAATAMSSASPAAAARLARDRPELEGLNACDQCPKVFVSFESLKRHYKEHTGRKLPCPYTACDKTFFSESSLKTHLLIHSGDKPYQCSEPGCTFRCNQVGNLRAHVKTHRQIKSWGCPFCDMQSGSKRSMAVHIRIHTRDRPYACSYCKQTFNTPGNRRRHERIHERRLQNGHDALAPIRPPRHPSAPPSTSNGDPRATTMTATAAPAPAPAAPMTTAALAAHGSDALVLSPSPSPSPASRHPPNAMMMAMTMATHSDEPPSASYDDDAASLRQPPASASTHVHESFHPGDGGPWSAPMDGLPGLADADAYGIYPPHAAYAAYGHAGLLTHAHTHPHSTPTPMMPTDAHAAAQWEAAVAPMPQATGAAPPSPRRTDHAQAALTPQTDGDMMVALGALGAAAAMGHASRAALGHASHAARAPGPPDALSSDLDDDAFLMGPEHAMPATPASGSTEALDTHIRER